MKKGIEIEKWFRAKGTDTYFKTEEEAAEYARKEYAGDLLRRIALAYDYRKECVKKIKSMKVFIEEAKSKSDLRKAWAMRQSGTFPSLYSKKAGSSITLLIDADLESRKGLHYLHEIVIYHAKEEVKKNEEKIRRYKTTIKKLSREFQKLREAF